MSLRNCLKRLGLDQHEAAVLRGYAKDLNADGFSAREAALEAIKDRIAETQGERDDILSQIREQAPEAFAAQEQTTRQEPTELDRELIAELRRAEGIEEPVNATLQATPETTVTFEPIKGNRFVVKTDNKEAVKKLRALKGAVVSKTAGGVVIPAAQRQAAETLLGMNVVPMRAEAQPAAEAAPVAEALPGTTVAPSETAPEAETARRQEVAPAEAATDKNYAKFLDGVVRRFQMESEGHGILDDMEDQQVSPASVSAEFWSKTYPLLNGETRARFEKYAGRLSGMEPGSVTSYNVKTGERTVAEGWLDVAKAIESDLPQEARNLEGTERGYIALMRWANEQRTRGEPNAAPAVKELPAAEPAAPPDVASKSDGLFSLENPAQRADTSRTEITSDDQAIERFRDSLQAVGIPREAIAAGNLRPDSARSISQLGDLIGRRIVVFRNTDPAKFNASGFVHNADNSVIYLDQNASRNYLAIVGHEFLHTLKAEHSDLYRQFLRDTVDVLDAKELEAMIGKLEKRRASYGLEPLPRSVAIEEAVADFFGDQFMDRKFWEETAARNPSMMQRIAKAFADWINAMIAKVRKGNETGKLFFDLQKARAAAASVLAEHMKRTPSKADTEGGKFSLEDRQDAVARARGISVAKQQQLVQGLPAGQPVTWTYDTSRWEGWRGKLRKAREYTQDKLVSVLYAQEDIEKVRGALEDDANVHRRENLMHGRVGARLDLFEKTQTRPLWNAIKKAGLAPELVEDYLEARHAEERNASVAKKNKDMPDGGSGMTNAQAQAFLTGKDKGLRSGKKLDATTKAKLEAVAKRVDAIAQQTRNILVSSGLITQEQKDAMEAAYKTYVPLRGKDGVDIGFQPRATGKGIDVRGKPVQRALGRGEGNRAQNILAEIIGDAERVIVQAEKARVGRTAVKLALENPNPDLWEVEPVEVEQKFSEATEQVYWGVRNLMNDPETLVVPFQGKKYNLYLKDPQIRDALKNLAVDQLPQYLRWFSALNRYFSAIYTRFAPEFVTTNMMRDANLGLIGLSSEQGTKIAAKAAASYAAAWQGLWREARGKQMQGKWQKAAREFEEAGGKTYFSRYENVEDIQRRIASEFRGFWELTKEGKLGTAVSKAVGDNPLVKAIGDLNDVVENTLRLAAYQALREEGVSIEKAAKYAKDLTVNFNKRGSATSVLNSFYLFFNASVQGITRTVKLMKQPKVQATLGTLAGLQFMLALMAMGVEDDDGEPLWNKIQEWEKQRNLIFPYITEKDGKKSVTVFKIPMPYGFNLFPYIGGRMAQLFSDVSNDRDVKASDIVNDIGAAVGQSLTPIPIHEGWQAFLPEILKIAHSLSVNKDDLGIPITKEQPYSKYDIPRSSLGRESTPEAFKTISKTLNRIGGGDDYTPPKVLKSLLDWSPEDLQFLFETFTGGIGTTGRRTVGLVENVIADIKVSPRDVPVLRSLVSNVDTKRATANLYYERVDVIERELARVRDAAKDGDKTPLDAAKDPDIAAGFNVIAKKKKGEMDVTIKSKSGSLFDAYKEASKAVSEINKDIQKVYAGTLPFTDRKREIDRLQKEREEAMKAMNAAWNAMKRGRSELELQ